MSASISACPSYITTTTTVVPTQTVTTESGGGGGVVIPACKVLYSGNIILESGKSWDIIALASLPAGYYTLTFSASIPSDSNPSNNYRNVYMTVREVLPIFVVNFKAGWNLFSFPVSSLAGGTSNCSPESTSYGMRNGNYYETTNFIGGYGYWIKMKSDCTANVTGRNITISDFPELTAGWNMIGAPTDAVKIADVKGTCNILRGPLWYDPSIGNYVAYDALQPGKGYFIKVSSSCRLGIGLPPPPPE
jgi:hypothetical protein